MSIKSLAKSSGVYLISNVFSMGILFLLIPVLTRYLTPESYAVISMFEAVLAIIVPIVGLNLYGAISVNYYRSNEDIDEFIWNVFLLIVFMSIIVTILFFIFRSQLSGLLGIDVSWLLLIPLLALSKS
ncbi:MAG: oligosaccharide flippase family protein, partial [Deltaproteobacteria bacterium]|nr:oligosaccharide flippase family protein [Deltaproteobacteria bacterium]